MPDPDAEAVRRFLGATSKYWLLCVACSIMTLHTGGCCMIGDDLHVCTATVTLMHALGIPGAGRQYRPDVWKDMFLLWLAFFEKHLARH